MGHALVADLARVWLGDLWYPPAHGGQSLQAFTSFWVFGLLPGVWDASNKENADGAIGIYRKCPVRDQVRKGLLPHFALSMRHTTDIVTLLKIWPDTPHNCSCFGRLRLGWARFWPGAAFWLVISSGIRGSSLQAFTPFGWLLHGA